MRVLHTVRGEDLQAGDYLPGIGTVTQLKTHTNETGSVILITFVGRTQPLAVHPAHQVTVEKEQSE